MPQKKTVLDFQRMKKDGEKVTWLTAYDYPTAQFEEQAKSVNSTGHIFWRNLSWP